MILMLTVLKFQEGKYINVTENFLPMLKFTFPTPTSDMCWFSTH